ncbi:hypothetical protein GPECTOR_2g1407 [Gonium pectorale]|uniref:Uncharacterized protein n=1 Tax=Gonium pectorale TaxID=33097 RepID=A0A150H114_GONPE|nr:hypothetical protein GPECTOR_2g1407 [Gonium pectorale]|eukprot:KXZ55856.1 hypothetical protein GPECTOR_2g1407 [Gonium pectorale]
MRPGPPASAWLALLFIQCAWLNGWVLSDDPVYYEEYGHGGWNDTDDYGGAGFVPPAAAHRHFPQYSYGYPEEQQPRMWSRAIPEGDYVEEADPLGLAAPAPPGGISRRFGGPIRHGGDSGASCPGGVCPNSDAFNQYDVHYDPRYPFDSCHYLGGFASFRLNGTEACHLEVRGADGHADRLTGGLDGRYLLAGCFEGKPVYIRSRADGPAGEDRTLYYNPHFGAWEFSVGAEPNADQLVMAGDEGSVSPLDVARWHMAAAFNSEQAALLPSDDEELYYVAAGVSVMCAGPGEQGLLLKSGEDAAAMAAAATAEAGEEEGEKGRGGRARRMRRGREVGGEGEGGVDGVAGLERRESGGEEEGEGQEGSEPGHWDLAKEARELRDYWRRHEEEYYEMRYQYGEYGPDGAYDDEAHGPGYDDGYGLY